jgi:putative ABC transport system permease protein
MIPIAYNLRNLAVRRTTTLAAAAGLGLVVFVFSSVLMLSNGIERTMGRSGKEDIAIVIRKGSEGELASGIEDAQIGQTLANPEVARAPDGSPEGVGEIVVVVILEKLDAKEGMSSNVQIRGVPDNALKFRKDARIVEGRAAQPGTDEVIVGRAIAGRFKGVTLGGGFELRKNRPVKVVGIFEDDGSSYESEVWADVGVLRAAFGREGTVSSIRARLTSPGRLDAFRMAIEADPKLGMQVLRETDYYEKQSEGTSLFIKAMGIVIAVFFSIGAMIGAMITMHASIANRQREIGTLRALGFSRASILSSFLIESVLLALFGGALGAAASLLMGMVHFSTMNFASFSEIVFSFEPTPWILGRAMIAAGVMGLVGGFFPAVRAARMSPIDAMRA